MTSEKKYSPLLVEEDWWTVWFGLTILLIATILGILTLSFPPHQPNYRLIIWALPSREWCRLQSTGDRES